MKSKIDYMRLWRLNNKNRIKLNNKKYVSKNKKVLSEKHKIYIKNNPEKAKQYHKNYSLKYPEKIKENRKKYTQKYGYKPKSELQKLKNKVSRLKIKLTLKEYKNLIIKQNNLCAICLNTCKTKRALSIDHNHITGKVRGLLCMKCNRAIGLFNDNPSLVQNAYNYLTNNN